MPLLKRNVALAGEMELSAWRSLALVAWDSVSDASVHAVVEVDAAPMLRYLEKLEKGSGVRVSPAHFAGKAIADAFHHLPDLNCLLRRGRIYRRRDVDIFFPVALDHDGEDLSGTIIRNVDTKPIDEIARELQAAAGRLRKKDSKSSKPIRSHFLRRISLQIAGFFLYTLNVWVPAFGIPRDAFGSVAVTDMTGFDSDYAFPPLLPFARLPLVVGVCGLFDRYDAKGKPVKWLRLCFVFDHRIIDGVYAGRISRHLRSIWADPKRHFDTDPSSKGKT